ncbi:D-alanyl-D-alanine carboxypeptidase family protein [Lutispora thermophila]|uniref:serine-type D-Ala-D-Ala carboxypeptidase n=1 Tax=Lutispora thermophila DSM 19022 TaxID=1122184 RepID=A0A1M6F6P8_9FIRM|nr:D-alanyl-D-alanine carboxypeptidase family protein [Lutispora thermophila]SHI93398.1 D-alanyl-D-alanine carboxypeptidase (penicillin-binding protein 5/6) [Lutispora thermophila DSM 19022]
MVKYKKIISIISLIMIIIIINQPLLVNGDNEITLNCKSALLMEASTGEIIYEMNSHDRLEPASVTKIMTMLLTMEALDSGRITLDDKVTISKKASKMTGTCLLLEEGEVRSVNELLTGIAVESANDASVAIAEYIAGSEEEFVNMMNKKAQDIGMSDTHFKNPHGLHEEGHVTSAHDVAIMSRELLKYEKIFDYISIYMTKVTVGKKNNVVRELVNKNKMVRFYDDVDGIKTGFTENAMYCISATAKRNNLRFISVIMGAPSTGSRNSDARKLLDYGFANYSTYTIGKKGDVIKTIEVSKGNKPSINAMFEQDVNILIKKGEEKQLEAKLNLPDKISAPIAKGDKLGYVIITKNGETIQNIPIISQEDVPKASFINNILKALKYWIEN